jgi:hypothetical protein
MSAEEMRETVMKEKLVVDRLAETLAVKRAEYRKVLALHKAAQRLLLGLYEEAGRQVQQEEARIDERER